MWLQKSRAVRAVVRGVLGSVGMALIAAGVDLIGAGNQIAGGVLCGVGAILLIVDLYIGG